MRKHFLKLFTILGQPDDPQILVEFDFPDGMESGQPYKGFQISCSLKDDEDGKLALILMKNPIGCEPSPRPIA